MCNKNVGYSVSLPQHFQYISALRFSLLSFSLHNRQNLLLTSINFYSAHRCWKIGPKQIVNHRAERRRWERKTDDYKKTIYSNGKQAFAFDCAHSWIHASAERIAEEEAVEKNSYFLNIRQNSRLVIYKRHLQARNSVWAVCIYTEDMLI